MPETSERLIGPGRPAELAGWPRAWLHASRLSQQWLSLSDAYAARDREVIPSTFDPPAG